MGQQEKSFTVSPPAINLPKGGGAIRGIDEEFGANPTHEAIRLLQEIKKLRKAQNVA